MTEPSSRRTASGIDAMERSREEQARRELAVTCIAPWLARATMAGFIAVVAGVPAVQAVALLVSERGGEMRALAACDLSGVAGTPAGGMAGAWARLRTANRELLRRLAACEGALEETSPVRAWLRPGVQYAMTALGRAGSAQVHVAAGGWLFFRPDVAHVAGPDVLDAAARPPRIVRETDVPRARDPVPAIVAFRDALARRGMTLVVVPTPVKPTVHPEKAAAGHDEPTAPLHNRGFDRLVAVLRRAGVEVVDVAPALVELAGTAPVYLATDTHWRPEAVRVAAREVARRIEALGVLGPRAGGAFVERMAAVQQHGDSIALLGLPPWQALFPPERVVIRPVSGSDGAPWRPDPRAETLVLGDSFTNIYSLGTMGWGESAGFAEQLALALDRPVDRIVQNADGAYATRERLSRELAAGRDRLAGKRVVVWQFAARELSWGDWRVVPLPEPAAPERRFIVPPAGATWVVTGRVAAMARVPRPGTVPYRDHIAALHLTRIRVPGTDSDAGEALVYVLTMRNNTWTAAAGYGVGDTIRLRLRPWSDVAADYEGISRSELDDAAWLAAEPCWGEPAEPGR